MQIPLFWCAEKKNQAYLRLLQFVEVWCDVEENSIKSTRKTDATAKQDEQHKVRICGREVHHLWDKTLSLESYLNHNSCCSDIFTPWNRFSAMNQNITKRNCKIVQLINLLCYCGTISTAQRPSQPFPRGTMTPEWLGSSQCQCTISLLIWSNFTLCNQNQHHSCDCW